MQGAAQPVSIKNPEVSLTAHDCFMLFFDVPMSKILVYSPFIVRGAWA